jgi:CheY-like chemotaxis protein
VARGAGLTRQLLAFSRQQPIAPTVLDLNSLLRDTSRMLARLLGESVELVVAPSAQPLHVRADRNQLEQVLLNLAVNARDAISGHGRVSLELAAVHVDARDRLQHPEARPGEFVRLRVTDTGSGMDTATQARIFEPFFTTKPIGSGTGLGLSMVHGIVTKAGGFVQVASRPGAGSTFDVWLPLVKEARTADVAELAARRGGSETVLLVEDEELVLRLATALLNQLGYRVLASPLAEHALARIEAKEPFDLLLTDVLLPGIDGPELYRRAARERGAFPVVFMSGYTADVLAEKGLAETGAAFLQKPFSHDELAAKVRAALDAHAALGTRSG